MKTIVKILTVFLFWIFFQETAIAQESASLNCLQVDENGNVTLLWTQPTNILDFEKNVIYFSLNGITFSELTTITDPSTESFLDLSADALSKSVSYFIQTFYQTASESSDTLSSIYLQIDNLPNFNEAKLYWSELKKPLPGSASATYNVYKEYPLNNWNLIASLVDKYEYSEPVIVCLDSINYRIEVENSSGCESVSNVKGAWFKNIEEPDKPEIDSVSISSNGYAVIGWESVGNAEAYIVYRFDAGIWTSIDTVYGQGSTFYEDIYSEPCSKNLTYSVATIDTCGSSGPKDENENRKTLRILEANFNACNESVQLVWNHYRGPDADSYEIWASEDEGEFIKIGETLLNDTTFTDSISNIGAKFTYFIRAKFSSGTSTTCKKTISTYSYLKPDFVYFANANVLPTNKIELTIEVDTSVNSCSWDIYQENLQAVVVSKIASIQKSEADSFPLTFIDTTVAPELTNYAYNVVVLDSCGNELLESNFVKTIWLTGSSINIEQNFLEWTAFEGWDAGVEKYYIFRMFDGVEPTTPFDSVDSQTLQYTDDLSLLSTISGPPVYWVQAVESEGNKFNLKEKANSNRIGVAKDSEMYVANAFRPLGYSPEFKPVFRYFSGKNYVFQIFNRWGQLIFETNNPEQGWDGTFNGEIVEQGTYIYRLVYQYLDDSSTEKKGTVTVIY